MSNLIRTRGIVSARKLLAFHSFIHAAFHEWYVSSKYYCNSLLLDRYLVLFSSLSLSSPELMYDLSLLVYSDILLLNQLFF